MEARWAVGSTNDSRRMDAKALKKKRAIKPVFYGASELAISLLRNRRPNDQAALEGQVRRCRVVITCHACWWIRHFSLRSGEADHWQTLERYR